MIRRARQGVFLSAVIACLGCPPVEEYPVEVATELPARIVLPVDAVVAIAPIQGTGGEDLADLLGDYMRQKYHVVDRTNLAAVTQERYLNGSHDAETARMSGADVVLVGRISALDVVQNFAWDERYHGLMLQTTYSRVVRTVMRVAIKVIDTQTATVLGTANLDLSAADAPEKVIVNGHAHADNAFLQQLFPAVDVHAYVYGGLERAAQAWMAQVEPTVETTVVVLYGPPGHPMTQSIVEAARHGCWDAAISMSRQALFLADRSTLMALQARAHYNLGVCLLYGGGKLWEAVTELMQARAMVDDRRMLDAIEAHLATAERLHEAPQ